MMFCAIRNLTNLKTMAEEYRGTIFKLMLLLFLFALIQFADSGSVVRFLPGFDGPLPFYLETGYIGVGEAEELQLFYYFIKSESNPEEDPLLIWLSGGPGCSSLSALLLENGPIAFKGDAYNGDVPTLVSTTYSWTKVANIIYLDQPVGTGFSYSTASFIETASDTGVAKLVAEFVHKWLAKHPKFFSNPFYVSGDSYSGKIVPAIVQEISNENYVCCKPQINLQGYVLGNPVTNPDTVANAYYVSRIPFSHGMALISDELYESLKRSCRGNYIHVDPLNTECVKLIAEFEKCVEKLFFEHILLPQVNETSPPGCHRCPRGLAFYWANDDRVRRALQVKKGSIGKWIRCFHDIPYNKDIEDSFPYHKNNSIKGYRSLIFSGDHDLIVPKIDTQAWIRALNYSIVDEWRPWMIDDQVGGYTRTYANKMTFATVKGGGHTAEYAPLKTSIMFKRWLSGQLL